VTEPIRVMIVDDHASFTESLQEVLRRYSDIEVVATAGSVAEAVRVATEVRPRVILMDQRLPDGSGALAAARVFTAGVETSIVMLTGGGGEDDLLDAVQAGASGYLLKTGRVTEIVDAIRRVAAGELLIPASTLSELLQRARERTRVHADRAAIIGSLTPRERDVLRRMATPDDVGKIAESLGISRHTTRGYMQTVIEKLGAHSRLEAVLRAQELGLLEG
jgi:DNA-binding NarL/FixJ family response regulator